MLNRLRDRKLIQWASAYLAGAWLALQVLDILGDKFAWPLAIQQGIIILLAFGLPIGGPAIAVVPFASQGDSDAESAAFARGIHADLVTQLSKIRALTVISATSVAEYAGTTKSRVQIGRELAVDAILEGSVQRAGERVRINVQLIDAASDSHLWAETYDRRLTVSEILSIQGEISRLVARSLAATLTPEEASRITHRTTDDLGAFDYVARARLLLPQRSLENHREGMRLLREAVALDSTYASAWGMLAGAMALGALRHWDPESLADSAEIFAERALALDPDEPDAYRALGLVAYVRGRVRESLEYTLAAVEREPSHQASVNNIGVGYHDLGRFDEAMRWIRRSVRLAPTNTFLRTNIAGIYIHLGEFELAKDRLREVAGLNPEGVDVTAQLISLYRAAGETDSLLATAREYNAYGREIAITGAGSL